MKPYRGILAALILSQAVAQAQVQGNEAQLRAVPENPEHSDEDTREINALLKRFSRAVFENSPQNAVRELSAGDKERFGEQLPRRFATLNPAQRKFVESWSLRLGNMQSVLRLPISVARSGDEAEVTIPAGKSLPKVQFRVIREGEWKLDIDDRIEQEVFVRSYEQLLLRMGAGDIWPEGWPKDLRQSDEIIIRQTLIPFNSAAS